MTRLNGAVVLLTGASGGLGPYLARSLSAAGARLALLARSAPDLERVAEEIRREGGEAVALPIDLTEPSAAGEAAARAREALGDVVVLVNNAGAELTRRYHEVPPADIERVIRLNLTAPMLLTREVLPGMLERRRGHVVSIASLAGKAAPAFHETYSATKAGLIAFSLSLRASYPKSGVGFSVVTPGFIHGAGMHQRAKDESRVRTPAAVGSKPPEAVAAAVMEALRTGAPEIVVAPLGARVMEGLLHPFPATAQWVMERLGVTEMYRRIAERRSPGG